MLLPLISPPSAQAYHTRYMVVVLIDGVRYTESLGDTTHAYAPRMWALSTQGAVLDSAFNDSVTVTNFGIPATWMGRFWPLQDTIYQGQSIQFCRFPTSWEYARHDLGLPIEKAIYVTPDYGSSTWMPSFDSNYGPSYWPHMVQPPTSDNNNQADFDSSVVVIRRDHPVISYIYLPDTDHAGHSGVWADYIAKIRQADSLVNELWNVIQADSIMSDKTIMIVTNDHGRHDDAHGGFRNHGDSCFGCRHVMLFAVGPDIAQGVHLNSPRASIRDIAHTAGELLGFATPLSPGRVLSELFAPSTGAIFGVVTDSADNAPLEGVLVRAFRDTLFVKSDTTDLFGRYFLGELQPGAYDIDVSMPGCFPQFLHDIQILADDTTHINFTLRREGPPPCRYLPGDVNNSAEVNGLDVIYLVNYFKGGSAPPLICDNGSGPFFVAADINGDCATNGLDVIWFVNYLKGGSPISHCPDYPPGG